MDVKNYRKLLASVTVWVVIVLVYEASKFHYFNDAKTDFVQKKADVREITSMLGIKYETDTVWPKPQNIITKSKVFTISSINFKIDYTLKSHKCADVDNAVNRYMKIIFGNISNKTVQTNNTLLDQLFIHVGKPCEKYPHFRTSESYNLEITSTAMLVAETQWGIMRGLETFAQLLHLNRKKEIVINEASIKDFPRFPYRGLMIDTARHFIPVELILQNLEIMSYNKLNVFHWHITDHQSFPLLLPGLPQLAVKGAYDYENAVYTEADVKRIVEYARERGIRVIPEIDLPAHAQSISKSKPELFVSCTVTKKNKQLYMGTLDPTNPEIFPFVSKLYAEVKKLFPGEFIHIGGDEVPHDCWSSNQRIKEFLSKKQMKYDDLDQLLIEGLLKEAEKLNMSTMSWHDVIRTDFKKTPTQIVVWEMGQPSRVVRSLTSNSIDVIIAYSWYLDITLKKKWDILYETEPAIYADSKSLHHVIGGQSCMWTEHIEESNIMTEIWPAASAAAEKLWSSRRVTNLQDAMRRLSNFRCVLKCRNVASSPLSPGYCHID